MYTVGDSLTMTCTLNGATKIELLRNGTVVLNGAQTQLVLQLLNSDSIHHNLSVHLLRDLHANASPLID